MADKKPGLRAKLIEIFTRVITLSKDKDESVYWNGENNLYPNEIEGVICNSPTAKSSSKILAKYIAGSGVSDANGLKIKYSDLEFVNKKKAYKITDIIRIASQNISKQYGVWFHISWGFDEKGNLIQKSIDVLDYCKCRKTKEDDEENPGKIKYKDFADKGSLFNSSKPKSKWFYPYSNDKDVVMSQIKADYDSKGEEFEILEAIKSYRGQVFYLNLTPEYVYALSPYDAVYNDCDSEYRFGLYTNTQLRTGFLGKLLILTQGLDEEASKKVISDVSGWLGSENSGSAYHLDVEQTDSLDNVLKIIQPKAMFDDKLFEVTDKRLKRNILSAANNIPEALINAGEGALFGTNSETYKEMKLFFSEQTEEEREKLEETLTYLGFPCKILPIIQPETIKQNTNDL